MTKGLADQLNSLAVGGFVSLAIAMPPALLPTSATAGNAITVGANACANGHGVSAGDCIYYTVGGKVTVCHFENHEGDVAVANPSDCAGAD